MKLKNEKMEMETKWKKGERRKKKHEKSKTSKKQKNARADTIGTRRDRMLFPTWVKA